jgi:hypothetical protein
MNADMNAQRHEADDDNADTKVQQVMARGVGSTRQRVSQGVTPMPAVRDD